MSDPTGFLARTLWEAARPALVCLASGLLVGWVPALRRPAGVLAVSLAAAWAIRGPHMPGFLATHALIYLLLVGGERLASRRLGEAIRWRLGCGLLALVLVAFCLGRWHRPHAVSFQVLGL